MKKNFLTIVCFILLCVLFFSCNQPLKKTTGSIPLEVTITKQELLNKIKGGWAGQTIGCTFGGPTEFRFCGTMMQDYVSIPWLLFRTTSLLLWKKRSK